MNRSLRALALLACLALMACSNAQASPTPTTPASPTVAPTSGPTAAPTPVPTGTPAGPTAAPTITAAPTAAPTGSPVPVGAFDPNSGLTLHTNVFAGGFDNLTFATNAGDGSGRMFAVEQIGRINAIDSAGGIDPTPFLDIHQRISSGGERGLLGLAFHPDFGTNGRFFVNYTAKDGGDTVISEFGLDSAGRGNPDSERILLTIDQPYANHNGGMVAFGPDGYLYIGMGDGGSGGDPHGNSQNMRALLGKILRIDVDSGDPYGIPEGNPFVGAAAARPEIWDVGMRNPWRFSFDRNTGALIIGDVGQGQWEEIDLEPAATGGFNYGWNVLEGDACYLRANCDPAAFAAPAWVYSHAQGCTVIGGYVYRGARFADVLNGAYLFSDYCSGTLWAFNADDALGAGQVRVAELGGVSFSPAAFAEDEAGELYIVGLGGGIHRLEVGPPAQ